MTKGRIKRVLSTHPDIAALVTPLSASRIEGRKEQRLLDQRVRTEKGSLFLVPKNPYSPLCGEAGERVVQRSVDRVSRFCAMTLGIVQMFNNTLCLFKRPRLNTQ